jgi:glycerophosphoryl diester phosphodiesterase
MFFRVFFVVLILTSCTKSQDFSSVKVIGHAATGLKNISSVYHDNSEEALELALSYPGCSGVELDVQLSKDHKLWFCHDLNLEEEIGVLDCIPEMDSESLNQLHYQTLKKEKLFPMEKLKLKQWEGKTLIFDIKHYNACSNEILSSIDFINALNNYQIDGIEYFINLSKNDWLESFYNAGFSRVIMTIHSYSDFVALSSKAEMFVGIMARNSELSAEEVKLIKQEGKLVFLYEVRAAKESRKALSKLPDFLLTDDLRTTLIEK